VLLPSLPKAGGSLKIKPEHIHIIKNALRNRLGSQIRIPGLGLRIGQSILPKEGLKK
jgi:hypothetical protein